MQDQDHQRPMHIILMLVLVFIALVGICAGMCLTIATYFGEKGDSLGMVGSLTAGAVPFIAGTIALGAAAVVAVIDEVATAHLVLMERQLGRE